MKNIARAFVASWFLGGWVVHIYLTFTKPQIYQSFGETALMSLLHNAWYTIIMPNITVFALLLAVFELVTGILLVSKGGWVRIGLVSAAGFSLFLVILGLGYKAANPLQDFMVNRLPNLLLIGIDVALLRVQFNQSLPRAITDALRRIMAIRTPKLR